MTGKTKTSPRADGDAGFQEAAGFAIEFGARRQLCARKQQGGVLSVIGQPGFGTIQSLERFLSLEFAVREHGGFVPLFVEALT